MTMSSPQAERVVAALTDQGLLEAGQRQRAEAVVAAALVTGQRPEADSSGEGGLPRVAEVVAYLGGALVLAAGILFVALQWSDLSGTGQVLFLGAVTVVLGVAGGVAMRGGGEPQSRARRRLAALLLVGATLAAGWTVGRWVSLLGDEWNDVYLPGLLAALTTLVLVVLVQRVLPSPLGLVVMMGAILLAIVFAVAGLDDRGGEIVAVSFWVVGLIWLVLTETVGLGGREVARPLGVAAALLGGQVGVVTPSEWIGYLLTALVALLSLLGYLARPSWPYLAGAVIAVTLAVPEAVADWTNGSLGVVGGVLLAGITLLGAALGSVQLSRRRRAPDPA